MDADAKGGRAPPAAFPHHHVGVLNGRSLVGLWLCSDWKVSLCAVFTSLPTWPGDCLSIAIWPSGEPQGLASDVFCCPREFWLLVGGDGGTRQPLLPVCGLWSFGDVPTCSELYRVSREAR